QGGRRAAGIRDLEIQRFAGLLADGQRPRRRRRTPHGERQPELREVGVRIQTAKGRRHVGSPRQGRLRSEEEHESLTPASLPGWSPLSASGCPLGHPDPFVTIGAARTPVMRFEFHVFAWLPYTRIDNLLWHLPDRERFGAAAAGPYFEGDQHVIPP